MEFMRNATTNRAGIGDNRAIVQTHAFKDITVGSVHNIVRSLQAVLAQVEAVRIFHGKFTATHNAKTRANFVAEFGLNLIQVNWQLFVAADFVAYQGCDHFFMSRAQYKVTLVAVFNAQ